MKSDVSHFQLNYKFYLWNRLHEFYLNDAIQRVDPRETDRIALENDIFRTKSILSSQYLVGFLVTESRRKISDRFLSNPIISETTQPNALKSTYQIMSDAFGMDRSRYCFQIIRVFLSKLQKKKEGKKIFFCFISEFNVDVRIVVFLLES